MLEKLIISKIQIKNPFCSKHPKTEIQSSKAVPKKGRAPDSKTDIPKMPLSRPHFNFPAQNERTGDRMAARHVSIREYTIMPSRAPPLHLRF